MSNFHSCVSRVEFYRVAQYVDLIFLPISIFFLLAGPRAFSDAPPWRFRPRYPKLCVMGFWNMPVLFICQICTFVFHVWNSIELDTVWLGDSCQWQFHFFSGVLARLTMPDGGIFEFEILNCAKWVFETCLFWSSVKFAQVCFTRGILSSCTACGLEILANVNFLSSCWSSGA